MRTNTRTHADDDTGDILTPMRRTRIKVCGLTRAGDVAVAVAAGADAIGVVFAASPRQVGIEQAAAALAAAPPPVARIGVFVDADPDFVMRAVRSCALSAVQFSGSEPPEVCSASPVPVVKTLRVGENFDWTAAEAYRGHVSALLLDTHVCGMAGGSGRAFAWGDIGEPPAWASVFVAGGLSPENVGECVRTLMPFAVDVSSGVEVSPGIKDAEMIKQFCAAVRAADEEVRTR
jgi:phosphoribosylanthranilate isomerase